MVEDVDKKGPEISNFIKTQEFNRLTERTFNAKMKEASKNFATKKQVSKKYT